MSSLQELIDLAKRTGDRLIIHDPYTERNMVIMDIDQYKGLVMGREQVRNLTSREMVEKINRELSVWRNNHEHEEREELAMVLHDELRDMPAFDPFADIGGEEEQEWHRVGEVMQREFSDVDFSPLDMEKEEDLIDEQDWYSDQKEESEVPPVVSDILALHDEPPLPPQEEEVTAEEITELRYEIPVVEPKNEALSPRDAASFFSRPVPRMPEEGTTVYEEPLTLRESPVFFEEPVE